MKVIKDRIALVLAIIAIIPGCIVSWEIFKPSPNSHIIVGIVGSIVAFLVVLFTIHGMMRVFLWFINVFKGESMKERLLDVIKWGLILLIVGAVFYVVCPKYDFFTVRSGLGVYRYNKITGDWKIRMLQDKKWRTPDLKQSERDSQ